MKSDVAAASLMQALADSADPGSKQSVVYLMFGKVWQYQSLHFLAHVLGVVAQIMSR